MPEGDSIRNVALLLGPVLPERPILAAYSRQPGTSFALAGRTVVRMEPIGKHLWLELDDGAALRIHMGMWGRCWIWSGEAGPRERPRPEALEQVSLRLVLDGAVVEWASVPTIERCRARERDRHPVLSALGPDVLGEAFEAELDEVMQRVGRTALPTVAEVLLDQAVACGIGNIYKNETLFVRGIDPFLAPGALPPERWRAAYLAARELMQRNVGLEHRRTTGAATPSEFWVYGRGGRPCLSCRAPVAQREHGRDLPRITWWCPRCQRGVGRRVRPA